MMEFKRVVAIACCGLLSLAMTGWNSAQSKSSQRTPASAPLKNSIDSSDLQIQSSVLRIEFDHNLRSRVSALFDPQPKPLTSFSASETANGVGHTWSDFALTSSHREAVTDEFGKGERLSLTGKSGDLRKSISVTIYADFPSLAIYDVEYTNDGSTPLAIRGWSNHQYSLTSLPSARRSCVLVLPEWLL